MTSSTYTLADLFCGCGGISHGFEQAGFRPIFGLDNHRDSLDTFVRNHPDALVAEEDITAVPIGHLNEVLEVPWGELDCMVGGPPCQSFSKNVPARDRFWDDERNFLFRWFLGAVETLGPKTVLIENVAELANAHNGSVRKQITDRLSELGYAVMWDRLLAADYGVPQMRRRVFFLASRIGTEEMTFPKPTHQSRESHSAFDGLGPALPYVTVRDAISDLPSLGAGEGANSMAYASGPKSEYQRMLRGNRSEVYDHEARDLAPTQLARIRAMKPGQRMRDLPKALQTRQAYGGAYGRLEWDKPALTITTWVFHPGSGRFGHPVDDRTVTMREAARLQGFRDDFRFCGSYNSKARQIGNAVPPILARAFAEVLVKQLDHYNKKERLQSAMS